MRLVRYWCLLALGAACFAQTVPSTITKTTGMIGIAEGEIARLNLLNPGVVVTPATGSTSSSATASCTAAVAYYDGAGNNLKSGTVSVAPGESMAFDLNSATDLALAANDRKEIRAVITLPAVPGATATSAPVAACKLIPTLEIFDSITLRTSVVLGRARVVQ